jgi:hypothetical protein
MFELFLVVSKFKTHSQQKGGQTFFFLESLRFDVDSSLFLT